MCHSLFVIFHSSRLVWQVEAYMKSMASGLFGILATLGGVPVIRAPPGGPAQMVSEHLCKVRDAVRGLALNPTRPSSHRATPLHVFTPATMLQPCLQPLPARTLTSSRVGVPACLRAHSISRMDVIDVDVEGVDVDDVEVVGGVDHGAACPGVTLV